MTLLRTTLFGETASYSASSGTGAIFNVNYTRDALGRIVTKLETIAGVATTYDYAYDIAGRLTEVKENGAVASTYTYDSNGNRLSHTTPLDTFAGAYDAQDRLISYGANSYAYTANGELTTKVENGQTTWYNYDVLGNLLNATLPNGDLVEYVIDAKNRRVGKKVNGVMTQGFLYKDQLNPIAELDGTGAVVSRFVYGSKFNVPDYMIKGGVTYRIISDHLGSPRLVVDSATGAVVQTYSYDEFGKEIAFTDPNNLGRLPFGFAGGLYDNHTGLPRFGARDYDATTGRWTSKDPIGFDGDGPNLYGYVMNNPIDIYDLTGLAGCGPGGLSFNHPLFGPCCDEHDDGYDACDPKPKCDIDFLYCMDDKCAEKYPPFSALYFRCREQAMVFYLLVVGPGFPYYHGHCGL